MEQYVFKANTQLMARCSFSQVTGQVVFEDYSSYYPAKRKKNLFN
mgnify:CR=1 FL=1